MPDRTYAPEFAHLDKQRSEMTVAVEFVRALIRSGRQGYRELRPFHDRYKAPDVLGEDIEKNKVAFEVTELVEGLAISLTDKGRNVIARWDRDQVISGIAERLMEKDGKSYYGGPYSRLILLIHTDEPMISREMMLDALETEFSPLSQIDEAHIVMRPRVTLPKPSEALEYVCQTFPVKIRQAA